MDPRTPHGDRYGLERLKYIHRMYDANSDGNLDFREFCNMVRHIRSSRGQPNARAAAEVEAEARSVVPGWGAGGEKNGAEEANRFY